MSHHALQSFQRSGLHCVSIMFVLFCIDKHRHLKQAWFLLINYWSAYPNYRVLSIATICTDIRFNFVTVSKEKLLEVTRTVCLPIQTLHYAISLLTQAS